MNANRMAIKATAADGVAKSRGVGFQRSVLDITSSQKLHTSCIDPPRIKITLWFATSFGFLIRSAASVRWNSAKLRIIEFAVIIAIFVMLEVEVEVSRGCGTKRGVGLLEINQPP